MAKKGNRINVKFKSTVSGHCYYSKKNRVNSKEKMIIMKFDPVVKKHVEYKEVKFK